MVRFPRPMADTHLQREYITVFDKEHFVQDFWY
jgi:hypothetical protein